MGPSTVLIIKSPQLIWMFYTFTYITFLHILEILNAEFLKGPTFQLILNSKLNYLFWISEKDAVVNTEASIWEQRCWLRAIWQRSLNPVSAELRPWEMSPFHSKVSEISWWPGHLLAILWRETNVIGRWRKKIFDPDTITAACCLLTLLRQHPQVPCPLPTPLPPCDWSMPLNIAH